MGLKGLYGEGLNRGSFFFDVSNVKIDSRVETIAV